LSDDDNKKSNNTESKNDDDIVEEKVTKGLVGEFKEFAVRGNVVDMGVGVVIGIAFSAIINSVVGDIIMPIIGFFTDNYNFTDLEIKLNENNSLTYGNLIQAVINFALIALVLFIIIKIFNKLRKEKKEDKEEDPKPTELDVLTEIRDLIKDK